ncbi:MAG TPA: PAS domain S-box protein [Anaerolineales bacterium]|jgi:PAS domain S-box-containing protein
MNKSAIRVLLIEDDPPDAELLIRMLRQHGFEPESLRVDNEPAFLAALSSRWDVLLADYTLPGFSSSRVLEIMNERGLETPVLLVSGTIGEDVAVESMRAGAYDYLVKGNLARLGTAIRNAINDKQLRDENRAAAEALRNSEGRFRKLIESAPYAFTLVDETGQLKYSSPSTRRLLGSPPGDGVGIDPLKYAHPDDLPSIREAIAAIGPKPDDSVTVRIRVRQHDASWRWLETTLTNLLHEPTVDAILLNYRDITESRRADEALRESEARKTAILESSLDCIISIDHEGRITEFNPAAEATFGHNRAHALGRLMVDLIIPPSLSQAHRDGFARYLASGTSNILGKRLELTGMRADGTEFPLELTVARMTTAGPPAFTAFLRDLSERKQALEALRSTEDKFRNIFENAVEGIYQTTPDGRYLAANPALAGMFGYDTPAELIACVTDLNRQFYVLPGRREEFKKLMEQHGAISKFESAICRRDGSTMWISESARAVRDEAGALLYYEGITEDISARREADRALRDSEANLAAAQRITHLGSWELDLANLQDLWANTLHMSDEVFRIFGRQPGEFEATSDNYFRAVHPDDRNKVSIAVKASLHTGGTYSIDYRVVRPDGSERTIHEESQIVSDEQDRPLKMVGTVQDVTDSRRAEQALRMSEERYRLLFDDNPLPMWVYDLETLAFLAVNEAAIQHYGYERAEFLSMTIKDIRSAEEAQRLQANLNSERSETERSGPWKHCKRDGTQIDVEIVSHAVTFGGRAARLILANDITERHRAEQALASERQLLRTLVDLIPDRIYVKDSESRFVLKNRADLNAMGASTPEEVIGKSDFDFYPRELAAQYLADEQAMLAAGESLIDHEEPGRDAEGHPRWILTTKVPVRDAQGRITGLVGIGRDITDRKLHESELEAVVTVSSALRRAAKRAEMPPIILDQLFELLKIDAAALATRDPVTGDTLIEWARGAWSGGSGRRIPPGEGISGQVISSGQPYLNNDASSDPRYIAPYSQENLPAVACVPLIAHEQTIGALWIAGKRPIVTTELHLLTAISNIAASALHRAALFEQTERRLQQLSALHSIDIAISSSFDLRFTLSILLEQVLIHLGVDATSILLLNPNTQFLEHVAGRGFLALRQERRQIRLGEDSAGRAALERRIVSIPDLQANASALAGSDLISTEKFVSYYGVPLIAKGQVKGVLEIFHRSSLHPDADWLSFLETLADQAAIAINDAGMFDSLQRSNTELVLAYDATIEGWSRALDLRDHETEGHAQRVTEVTLKLANALQLGAAEMLHMRRGALLHDIGKMGIPDSVLLKPGSLTDDEWAIMRMHPAYAYDMLRPIDFLHPALDIPYCHHEKWDGSGYPRGLKAESIPLAARIFTIVDVWDALLSDRPYRKAWAKDRVRDHIQAESGKHFDPAICKIFLDMKDTQ